MIRDLRKINHDLCRERTETLAAIVRLAGKRPLPGPRGSRVWELALILRRCSKLELRRRQS